MQVVRKWWSRGGRGGDEGSGGSEADAVEMRNIEPVAATSRGFGFTPSLLAIEAYLLIELHLQVLCSLRRSIFGQTLYGALLHRRFNAR